jgi:hypothetical protein
MSIIVGCYNPNKEFLLRLHIKLSFLEQFVKILDKDIGYFKYICSKFLALMYEKVREGLMGPQLTKFVLDERLEGTMRQTKI